MSLTESRRAGLGDADAVPARRAWLITWTVLFGAFCVSFTITILSVSRPAIARDLSADVSTLVWLISGPTIATALVGATAGKVGDLRGHRRVYLIGLVGAAVFCVLSALAWDGGSLIAFRVLGAAVGAATGPSSMAIINRVFRRERRAAALGYWSLVVAGGPVLGLVAGGPLVDAFGWRAIFWLQTPLFVLAALVAFVVLPETPLRPGVRFDVPGQLALMAALGGLLFGVDRGRTWGWGSPPVLTGFATFVVMTAVFVVVERRVEHPLVPLHYFSRRAFSAPIAVQFFTNFGYMGGFILAPKLLDEVRGLSPGAISLLLIPRPFVFAVCGPIAGYLVSRVGTRRFSVFGSMCMTASLGIMSLISRDPASAMVVMAIAISGIGMGSAQPALASSIANSVDDRDLGVAGATQQLMGQLGASLGMNLLDSIQVQRAAVVDVGTSFGQAYMVGAGVSAIGVLVAFGLRSRRQEHAAVSALVVATR